MTIDGGRREWREERGRRRPFKAKALNEVDAEQEKWSRNLVVCEISRELFVDTLRIW